MTTIGTISIINSPGQFENQYFLNNPDITFFKSVYRKHTNFSKYLQKDTKHNGNDNRIFSSGEPKKLTWTINSGGDDLLSKIYLEHKLTIEISEDTNICANLGSNIISDDLLNSLLFEIGKNKFYSNSIIQEVMGELNNNIVLGKSDTDTDTIPPCLSIVDGNIITCNNGNHHQYTTFSGGIRGCTLPSPAPSSSSSYTTEYFYLIPEYSFMKDYGLALPLLALNNETIQFSANYNSKNNITDNSNASLTLEVNLIKELIQLDTPERSRFLTNTLTYVTQSIKTKEITTEGSTVISSLFSLTKYLMLVGKPESDLNNNASKVSKSTPKSLNYKDLNINIESSGIYDKNINANVFNKLNIYENFIGSGRNLNDGGSNDSIGFIPFSVEPLNYTQPSGCISTLKGSIKNIYFNVSSKSEADLNKILLYSFNYNILQISNGRANLMATY